ncbi:unnamed protein product [Callosobruchus maculatus]|uniref:Uncharacterized protein n=1 Tax=Callosobruchus maculatus TaxID=64391 RepID=A0A653DWF1_CALMS|nr:unnamed protein product [Callosobruchus maculatus]
MVQPPDAIDSVWVQATSLLIGRCIAEKCQSQSDLTYHNNSVVQLILFVLIRASIKASSTMLVMGLVALSLLAISDSSAVPLDHSSSSVSVKHSGKDYSYTIQETHGVGVEPVNLVEQSSVQVVAKSGHPAGDGVHHVKQHHDPAQGHLEHQKADHVTEHHAAGKRHWIHLILDLLVLYYLAGLIQGHNGHDDHDHHQQDHHNHGHGRNGLDFVIGVLPEQHQQQHHDQGQVGLRSVAVQGQVVDPQVQGQFRAGFPVDPSQGQVRAVPTIVALPAQASVRQDHVDGSSRLCSSRTNSAKASLTLISGAVQNDHDVNAVIPQHEQDQVEVRSFQGGAPTPNQFRAFQGNAQDQFGVNGFFPVFQQDQGQAKQGLFVDRNQVQGIVSRFAGVPTQGGDVKGFFVDKNQLQGIVSRFAGTPTQENDVRRYFVDRNQLQGIIGRYGGIPSQENDLKRYFVDKNQIQDNVGVPSQDADLKRVFVDKNQIHDIVGRYGVPNQDNSVKAGGVEAFRLIPARDVPVVQVASGNGVRYPYAVLYPVYRYV